MRCDAITDATAVNGVSLGLLAKELGKLWAQVSSSQQLLTNTHSWKTKARAKLDKCGLELKQSCKSLIAENAEGCMCDTCNISNVTEYYTCWA